MMNTEIVTSSPDQFPATADDNQKPNISNPLLQINGILDYVEAYRARVKAFYFEVLLSQYRCPRCGGPLHMTGQSECSCVCGNTFDPTAAFQVSPCCQVKLIRRTFHYVCSRCYEIIPSRFLFDERLFDAEYFREMMRDSRSRAMAKKEEIRRLLAESRSGTLTLMDEPNFAAIPELLNDLDSFIHDNDYHLSDETFDLKSDFNMASYRTHILSLLNRSHLRFSDISSLTSDNRRDKVRRFITLVSMDNDREIDVQQDDKDLLIMRHNHEAYTEG